MVQQCGEGESKRMKRLWRFSERPVNCDSHGFWVQSWYSCAAQVIVWERNGKIAEFGNGMDILWRFFVFKLVSSDFGLSFYCLFRFVCLSPSPHTSNLNDLPSEVYMSLPAARLFKTILKSRWMYLSYLYMSYKLQ